VHKECCFAGDSRNLGGAGNGSVLLPKLGVAGSSPVARSSQRPLFSGSFSFPGVGRGTGGGQLVHTGYTPAATSSALVAEIIGAIGVRRAESNRRAPSSSASASACRQRRCSAAGAWWCPRMRAGRSPRPRRTLPSAGGLMGRPDEPHADLRVPAFESARRAPMSTSALRRLLASFEDIDLGMRARSCEVLDEAAAASPGAEAQVAWCLVLGHLTLMDEPADDPSTDRLLAALRAVVASDARGSFGSFLPTAGRTSPARLVAALVLGLERDDHGCVGIERMLDQLGASGVESSARSSIPARGASVACARRACPRGGLRAGRRRPGRSAAQFVRTWQRLSWLGMIYRARRSWGGLDHPATEREAAASGGASSTCRPSPRGSSAPALVRVRGRRRTRPGGLLPAPGPGRGGSRSHSG